MSKKSIKSIFGEKPFEALLTWRSGRLGALKESMEYYAKEHGSLGREDAITYRNVCTAYRGAKKREAVISAMDPYNRHRRNYLDRVLLSQRRTLLGLN